eukprot:6606938-Prymnesium_polylepis.1
MAAAQKRRKPKRLPPPTLVPLVAGHSLRSCVPSLVAPSPLDGDRLDAADDFAHAPNSGRDIRVLRRHDVRCTGAAPPAFTLDAAFGA